MKIKKKIYFSTTNLSLWIKKVFQILNKIGNNEIFPMKPSELEISLSVESYNRKTGKNRRNIYDAKISHNFQIIKNNDSKS